ncbi:MAG TPA: hypothetical protein VL989_03190 [Candidatus Sulfotelmatobacter sp.]|nr:hypothetical protein [Candidatus Sulfotelmatobacter sp.]
MKLSLSNKNAALIGLILCVLAGLIYNSWPLGYWLDRSTFYHGLASDLEKVNHPYFWLFIIGDVISSLMLIATGIIYHFKFRKSLQPRALDFLNLGLVMFGFFTATAALLPSECSITPILRCRSIAGQGLGIDAITSTLAALGLLMAAISMRYLSLHHKLPTWIHNLTQIIFALWLVCGLAFGYLALSSGKTHTIEQALLILSGLIIVLVGLNVYLIVASDSPL